MTCNSWTDAQVFKPGERIEFVVGPSRQLQAFRAMTPVTCSSESLSTVIHSNPSFRPPLWNCCGAEALIGRSEIP